MPVFFCILCVSVQHGECVYVRVNCQWTSVSLCVCVRVCVRTVRQVACSFNPFVFMREWGMGRGMC